MFISILYQALYRPHDLTRYLQQGRAARVRTVLGGGLLLWCVCAATAAVYGRIVHLHADDVVTMVIYPPFISYLLMVMAVQTSSIPAGTDQGTRVIFWFICTQTAITPLLMVGWSSAAAVSIQPNGGLNPGQVLLMILICGWALGLYLNFFLGMRPATLASIDIRWLICIGFLLGAGVLGSSPLMSRTGWVMLIPLCLGIGLAPLRLISWLGQAVWRSAPEGFDQLRLLPLPRTLARLRHICFHMPEQGVETLIAMAGRPGDAWLVRRFLRQIAGTDLAHRIYFRLSIHPAGKELVRAVPKLPSQHDILAQAYAELIAVDSPGAWRQTLDRCPPRLVPFPPDLQALEQLFTTATIIMQSRRWRDLQIAHSGLTAGTAEQPDAILKGLNRLWQCIDTVHTLTDLETDLGEVAEIFGDRSDWVGYLYASLGEQLMFLRSLEEG